MRINWGRAARAYCKCLWYYKEALAYWPEEQIKSKETQIGRRTTVQRRQAIATTTKRAPALVVAIVCLLFVESTHYSLLAFGALNKQNTRLMPAVTPLQSAREMCNWERERERERLYRRKRRAWDFRDGVPLTKAFEFFMWQKLNFCRSGPDLVLISARLLSRARGWAWECRCHLFCSHFLSFSLPVSRPLPVLSGFMCLSLSLYGLYVSLA